MNSLVSVVITTYDRELPILKRAIESVINQTYRNIEIIVVNDFPENKQLAFQIKEYIYSLNSKIIRYVAHKKSGGACKARNTGILYSKGKYIAFLDDDDEWNANKIEKQLQLFLTERVGVVYCYFNNISVNNTTKKVIPNTVDGNLYKDLLRGNCVGGMSMPLIRKEVFNKIGLFDENLMSSQDHDMWLRISRQYDFVCCKEFLVNRYAQRNSISFNIEKSKKGFFYFINKYKKIYEKDKKTYNFILNQKAKVWFSLGYYKESFGLFRKAISVKLFSKSNFIEPIKGLILFVKNKLYL